MSLMPLRSWWYLARPLKRLLKWFSRKLAKPETTPNCKILLVFFGYIRRRTLCETWFIVPRFKLVDLQYNFKVL